jgi:predicted phage terminase large subunit-like protein
LRSLRTNLGTLGLAGQYYQEPNNQEGALVKLSWFARHQTQPDLSLGTIIQSWDCASKAGLSNDYSVCSTWLRTESMHYMLDMRAIKAEYPELKKSVIQQGQIWNPNAILVEDKGSGISILQDMRRETTLPVIPIKIKKHENKAVRLGACAATVEAGKVSLPAGAPWVGDFEQELVMFPNGAHDDKVDSFSQYLNWARINGTGQWRIRTL